MFHIFFWMGAVGIAVGVVLAVQRWHFISDPTVVGSVVDVNTDRTGGPSHEEVWRQERGEVDQHQRVIEYRVGDQLCRYTEGSASNDRPKIGAPVHVRYSPSNPCGSAILDEGQEKWLGFILMGASFAWCLLWIGVRWLLKYQPK